MISKGTYQERDKNVFFNLDYNSPWTLFFNRDIYGSLTLPTIDRGGSPTARIRPVHMFGACKYSSPGRLGRVRQDHGWSPVVSGGRPHVE